MSKQSHLYNLLKRPLNTEKYTTFNDKQEQANSSTRKYQFEVAQGANKLELRKAFLLAFPGTKLESVNVVKVPASTKRMGRRKAVTAGWRKAVFTVAQPIEALAADI